MKPNVESERINLNGPWSSWFLPSRYTSGMTGSSGFHWPALLPAMVKMESDHSATVASGVHPALVVVHSTLVVVVDQVLAVYQD